MNGTACSPCILLSGRPPYVCMPLVNPQVVFQGKSPNFQIYPNKTLPNYIQLRFAKVRSGVAGWGVPVMTLVLRLLC